MAALSLGTAQIGQRYGIANRIGQPDAATAHAIIATAWERGIRGFDTAPSYGNAEQLLGDALRAINAVRDARVTTKLDAMADADGIRARLAASRERLGVPTLDAVLVRRTLLPEWDAMIPALRDARDGGVVRAIGVSVYQPDEALAALALSDVQVLQIPANALDRRFEDAGAFAAAALRGVAVHIRSAFLQGLLLMHEDEVPLRLAAARGAIGAFHTLAVRSAISPLVLALAVLRHRYPDAEVVVGAEHPQQVAEIADAWATEVPDTVVADVAALADRMPTALLDPSRWPAVV